MLQTMLRERFGLRYRTEERGHMAYALVKGDKAFPLHGVDPNRPRVTRQSAGGFSTMAISLPEFCSNFLSKRMDAPVLDMTGIPGVFEIDLKWDAPEGYAPNNPEMIRVVEQTLGLKLEKRKLPLSVLIIEHLEKRPNEN